jgi:hypothetical protein
MKVKILNRGIQFSAELKRRKQTLKFVQKINAGNLRGNFELAEGREKGSRSGGLLAVVERKSTKFEWKLARFEWKSTRFD